MATPPCGPPRGPAAAAEARTAAAGNDVCQRCLPGCDVGLAPVDLLQEDNSAGFKPPADKSALGSRLVGVRGHQPSEIPTDKPGFRAMRGRDGTDEIVQSVLAQERSPGGCSRWDSTAKQRPECTRRTNPLGDSVGAEGLGEALPGQAPLWCPRRGKRSPQGRPPEGGPE